MTTPGASTGAGAPARRRPSGDGRERANARWRARARSGVIVADDAVSAVSRALSAAGLEHLTLGADHEDADATACTLVPATVAKGLEFDRVVVVEPAAIVAAEPDERTGLRRLYVVLTRAVSGLTVVHAAAAAGAVAARRLVLVVPGPAGQDAVPGHRDARW